MLAPLLFAAIQVIAPADGTTLRGGHFTSLAWSSQRLGADAEEWEAFLSVDGGKFYSVRLTPHLDIGVRRFDVLIPNVDSDDVRLLIRTGNERKETILTMPQRFRIRAEATARRTAATRAQGPESARPNDPPVVQWSVGDRVECSATPPSITAEAKPGARSIDVALAVRPLPRSGGQTILSVWTGTIACPPRVARSADILRKSSRLNV